jgi:hypothetical protein
MKTTLAAVAALVIGTPTALAQIIIPTPQLAAPARISPAGGTFVYDYSAPNQAFVWSQTPAFGSQFQALPNHFLFCLRKLSEPSCSHATAVANLLPLNLTRAPLRAPATNSLLGYQYTYRPTLADDRLDEIVAWGVMGCTGPTDATCKFSGLQWLVLSTMELAVDNVSGTPFGGSYQIVATGRNTGSRETRPFTTRITEWAVLRDTLRDTCETNLNADGVRNELTLQAIFSDGSVRALSTLPRDAAGKFTSTGVRAIYRPGAATSTLDFTDVILPAMSGATSAGSHTVNVPASDRPRATAIRMMLDSGGAIYEPNENDNVAVDCEVLH